MNPQKINCSAKKFRDGEHIWFWFLNQKRISANFRFSAAQNEHSIQPLDIETMVTRLYLAGKLSDQHLAVMQEFGARRRAPNQHVYAENRAAAIWADAMAKVEAAARNKGWVE
ncbi:hypothetical protein FACS189421_12350 [Bacteroidia bacterium]|nr:hypothetical protein FACS189421_12350 [Bacteroidia bacterium]